MNGRQPDETTKAEKPARKNMEDKRILIAYIDEPSCHLTAGRMSGGLACCVHRDFQTAHQSCTPLPALVVSGVVKSGAFSVPKVQNDPCSAASPPRKLWKARPSALLHQWPSFHCLPTARCFWKSVFCCWPLTVLFVIGVSTFLPRCFHFSGLFEEGRMTSFGWLSTFNKNDLGVYCGSSIFSVKKILDLKMFSNSKKYICFTKILYIHFPTC